MTPKRIQRKRTKGWKLPPNTICVGRPSKWGNPFTIYDAMNRGYSFQAAQQGAVNLYRNAVEGGFLTVPYTIHETPRGRSFGAHKVKEITYQLRGKNLACWCALDQPCHADVLLDLANREAPA